MGRDRSARAGKTALLSLITLALAQGRSVAVSVVLAWDPVTVREDGAPITDLAGYRLFRSTASLLGRTTEQAMADPSVFKAAVGPSVTQWVADNLSDGGVYHFRLTAFNASGAQSGFNVDAGSLDVEVSTAVPQAPPRPVLADAYAYPNPARGNGTITFHVESGSTGGWELLIFNVAGQLVYKRSFDGSPGVVSRDGKIAYAYEQPWSPDGLGSGVYFFKAGIRSGGGIAAQGKFVVIR